MWLIFAILSLFCYTAADLFAKKNLNENNILTPLKFTVSYASFSFVIGIAVFVFRLGESGLAPWQILIENPIICLNLFTSFLYWALYLLSMKYVNLSISEAISGSSGVFYFVEMLLVNFLFGKLPAVSNMLHPLRLIPVIIVISLIALYPNVERFSKRKTETEVSKSGNERRRYYIGVAVLFTALVADSLDSLLTAVVMDEGTVGTVDYFMTCYCFGIVPILISLTVIRIKEKKWYIPFIHENRNSFLFYISAVISSLLYISASYFDAVRTGLLFLAYPVLPIIGAKLFLKEKHTWRQKTCIWIITLAAIVFCIADNVL